MMVFTSDSKQVILSEITKRSFLDAVLNSDTEYFTRKLQIATIKKCPSPLSLFCPTSRTKTAIAVSMVVYQFCHGFSFKKPHLKVCAFEVSMNNLISEQDVLYFSNPTDPSSSFLKSEYLGSGYFAILTVQVCDILSRFNPYSSISFSFSMP